MKSEQPRYHTIALVVALAVGPAAAQEDLEDEFIESTSVVLDGEFDLDAIMLRIGEIDDQPIGNGDVDGDRLIDVSDAIYLLNWLFRDGPDPMPLGCAPPGSQSSEPEPLDSASIFIEVNETDGESEILLSAESGDALQSLSVHDPFNRRVVDVRSPRGEQFGLREVSLESTAPSLEGARAAHPTGKYLVQAVTTDGDFLALLTELDHEVAPAPTFAWGIDGESLVVQWTPVEDAAEYEFELEQGDPGLELIIELEADASSVSVPLSLLQSGAECEISLATIAENGNKSVREEKLTIPETTGPSEGP